MPMLYLSLSPLALGTLSSPGYLEQISLSALLQPSNPLCISAEVIANSEDGYSEKADIWSVGITAIEVGRVLQGAFSSAVYPASCASPPVPSLAGGKLC